MQFVKDIALYSYWFFIQTHFKVAAYTVKPLKSESR